MHFFQGLLMGLSYLAPIGMQNIFVINTALRASRKQLAVIICIVAFFDLCLSWTAFLGMGILLETIPSLKTGILITGGILLTYMGCSLVRSKGNLAKSKVDISLAKATLLAMLVTWGNPQALIDSTLMLGAFRASLPPEGRIAFIAGVSIATPIWFGGLSLGMLFFSEKMNGDTLTWINRICGGIIFLYGLYLIWAGVSSVWQE